MALIPNRTRRGRGGNLTPPSTLKKMGQLGINREANQPALSTAAPSQSFVSKNQPQSTASPGFGVTTPNLQPPQLSGLNSTGNAPITIPNPAQTADKRLCEATGGVWDAATGTCDQSNAGPNQARCESAGGVWDGTSCSFDDAGGGSEQEQCEASGGTWNGTYCVLPIDPNPQYDTPEKCTAAGGEWTANGCIFGMQKDVEDIIEIDDPVDPIDPDDPNAEAGANLYGVETLFGRAGMRRIWGPGKTDIIRPPEGTPLTTAEPPDPTITPEEQCVADGGAWDGTSCIMPTTGTGGGGGAGGGGGGAGGGGTGGGGATPPTPEEQCAIDGGVWNGRICVFDIPDPVDTADPDGYDPNISREENICIQNGGTWDGTTCSYPAEPEGYDPELSREENICIQGGGTWDPATSSCKYPVTKPLGKDPLIPPEGFNGSNEVWQQANTEIGKDLYTLEQMFDMSTPRVVANGIVSAQRGVIDWIDDYNWPPELEQQLYDRAYVQFQAWATQFLDVYGTPWFDFLELPGGTDF